MANSKKLFEVIGAAALVGAIYKLGELKGSITTGIKFAKNPKKGEKLMQVIDETDKAFKALDEGKKVNVKVTKDDFICEVTDPEERGETAEEADDQPED